MNENKQNIPSFFIGKNEEEIIKYPFETYSLNRFLFQGQSGSGKTWGAFNIIGQTFFNQNYSWLIFDLTQMYTGTHIPNSRYNSILNKYSLSNKGIPMNQTNIILPIDTINKLNPQDLYYSSVTDCYRIPLWIICTNLNILFELEEINVENKDTLIDIIQNHLYQLKDNKQISLNEVQTSFDELIHFKFISKEERRDISKVLEVIQRLSLDIIEPNTKWSSIGKNFILSNENNINKCIFFSLFKYYEYPNLLSAYLSATLLELKELIRYFYFNHKLSNLGCYIDLFENYIHNTQSTAYLSIYEMLEFWGKTKLLQICASRELLPYSKINMDLFDYVFKYSINPNVGSVTLINNINKSSIKIYETVPTMMKVESILDNSDEVWYEHMYNRFKQSH